MKKIKKVKNVPGYKFGALVASTPNLTQVAVNHGAMTPGKIAANPPVAPRMPQTPQAPSTNLGGVGNIAGAIGGAATGIASALGIEQGKVGQIMGGIGQIASNFGPIGKIAGGALQTIGAFTGGGGSVDENTGEITEATGLTKLFGFGRSSRSLKAKSNRIKTSIQDKKTTEALREEYYSDPRNSMNNDIYATAAEGGITRRPVDALVSKGEIIYDPEEKKIMKVPGSKGKPNKKDDVPVRLKEGDIVLSNSPDLLIGDKTIADFVSSLTDAKDIKKRSKGTKDAVEANIKKALHMQESMKAERDIVKDYNQRGVLKAQDGLNWYSFNKNMNEFEYWDAEKNDYTPGYKRWVESLNEKQMKDILSGKYGDMSTYLGKNKNYNIKLDEAKRLMLDRKFGDWHKIGGNTYSTSMQKGLKPAGANLSGLASVDNSHNFVTGGNGYIHKVPIKKMNIDPTEYVEEDPMPGVVPGVGSGNQPNGNESPKKGPVKKEKKGMNVNWGDLAYQAASILTPLFDHEKPETVHYQVPNAKYKPVAYNVDPQLRATDEAYALARYNQANISPNTGAGMAYGLQAASNRAKQRADIFNNQQNMQNRTIGENVDIYNKWSQDYANIMNNVYDKAAANRAAARNINRSNRAQALQNWGHILRNDKQYAMENVKLEAMTPFLRYAYQNDEALRKMIHKNINRGYGS